MTCPSYLSPLAHGRSAGALTRDTSGENFGIPYSEPRGVQIGTSLFEQVFCPYFSSISHGASLSMLIDRRLAFSLSQTVFSIWSRGAFYFFPRFPRRKGFPSAWRCGTFSHTVPNRTVYRSATSQLGYRRLGNYLSSVLQGFVSFAYTSPSRLNSRGL